MCPICCFCGPLCQISKFAVNRDVAVSILFGKLFEFDLIRIVAVPSRVIFEFEFVCDMIENRSDNIE